MAKIKRFFECLLPVSVCNIECSYCYIVQENRRAMKTDNLLYPVDHIVRSLKKERLGGTCYFSLCGVGETMAQPELIPLVNGLLQEGHFVNITTNGTLSQKYDKLIDTCSDLIGHLHISFSFHYLEMKSRGWIDRFFENVNKMRSAGASVLVQFNLCDDYVPHLDEIKRLCLEKVGALPQVALTRNEKTKPMSIMTAGTPEEYHQTGKTFQSPLFDFTFKNFMVKRTEYCYAGEWSGVLDMKTGILKKCYMEPGEFNVFEDPDQTIPFVPVGCDCHNIYCVNSSHFMSLGIIPELKTPTYAQLRNRPEAQWYTAEMEEFLNSKLAESNKQHGPLRKWVLKNKGKSKREILSQFRFYQWLHKMKERNHG